MSVCVCVCVCVYDKGKPNHYGDALTGEIGAILSDLN